METATRPDLTILGRLPEQSVGFRGGPGDEGRIYD